MATTRIGIILIHGTMGSVLQKKGKKIWPLINGSDIDYINDLTPHTNKVEPSHMLTTYKLLKLNLKLKFDEVEEFVYDWRQNNLDHSSLLKNKIESMTSEVVYIVAHSMGGIVAKICLNEYKTNEDLKKVKKLITLGTPWRGSMESVKTLLYGSKIPQKYLTFIEKEASRKISSHFPSVYQLLPTDNYLSQLKQDNCVPYYFNDCYYDKFDDFFEEILKEKFVENHSYDRVFNDYYDLLNKDISKEIELHEIIGTGKPTIKMICENTRNEPYVTFDEGDGTVPISSAYSNLKNRENYFAYFVNKCSHNSMPMKPNVINLVENIIKGKEFVSTSSIFDDLDSQFYERFSGYISKVACPVDISIRDNEGNIIYGNIETINEEEIRNLLQKDYEVDNIGTTTYVIFDDDDETKITNFNGLVVDAYDKGLTSISLEKYEKGKLIEKKAFKTFEIDTNLQAELCLDDDTEKSSLNILRDGKIERTMELNDIAIEGTVTPPDTTINLYGENLIHLEDEKVYLGKDTVTLSVDSIESGDFEAKHTFVVIGGKEILVEGDALDLNSNILKHGKNEIEYFSVDEYDYSEKKRKIIIYYFHQLTQKIDFLFIDKLYLVNLKEDELYRQIAFRYQLERTQPTYEFDIDDGVTSNQVIYHDIDRNIKVRYVDIFGNEVIHSFLVDEKTSRKIIKGAASVTDVESFTDKLNLNNVRYQFKMNKQGNHTVLNEYNLNGSHSVLIFNEFAEIKIIKNVELEISFEILSEYINLTEERDYHFVFKVLDIDSENVIDLDLSAEITFIIETSHGENKVLKETGEVEYISSSESYILTLQLNAIKELLSEYWRPSEKVINTAKLDIINNANNTVIRGLDLTIAK
ncbi:lipase/acyltransferase domain-containing protein [Bacillus safensis]|uniref:lipase/acyltransferase domain-containing protein n=1 Tax=Bacillus safensis TaxID=561879 RepID=UPI001BAA56CD|nr:alpha/beta hydrolase [Bacillus safensis]MBR0639855.1 alpha/beta hydrolase [Bacillus safensis]